MKKLLSVVLLSLTALPIFAERQPYERYTNIVARQMFGALPANFDPTKPPSEVQKLSTKEEQERAKEEEKLRGAVRFTMINVSPAGETMVGFTDSSDPKKVKNYYLKVGEGKPWKVEAADPTNATMTIVNLKNGITLDLTLGEDSLKGGKDANKSASTAGTRKSHGPGDGDSLRYRREGRYKKLDTLIARLEEKSAAIDQREKAVEEKERMADAKAKDLEEKNKADEAPSSLQSELAAKVEKRFQQRQLKAQNAEAEKALEAAKATENDKSATDNSEVDNAEVDNVKSDSSEDEKKESSDVESSDE